MMIGYIWREKCILHALKASFHLTGRDIFFMRSIYFFTLHQDIFNKMCVTVPFIFIFSIDVSKFVDDDIYLQMD